MHLLLRTFLGFLAASCTITSFLSPATALDNVAPLGARPADLEGRAWQISNYFIDKEQTWPYRKIGQKSDAYISFESGVLKGSPGCGRFTGTYHRAGGQLTISAEWTNENEMPCVNDEKRNAEQILTTLTNVRGIHVAPAYWHSDALLLTDAKGSTQVTLSPMQRGKDLSELQDSFWHLVKLEGTHADLSGVIVEIGKGDIGFSTVSYFAMYPFGYNLSGLEFSPTAPLTASSNNKQSWRDQWVAHLLSADLRKASSYDFTQGTLTFLGRDRQAIVVLNSLKQEGIESRRWRIAEYRSDGTRHGDEEGLVDATELAEITFLHGRVEGTPGCGAWDGTYKVSGDRVAVQARWILAGACSPAGFAQDRLVEDAFKGDLRIEEKGDHFLLRDERGNARILLVPY
jgi:heat shock protein HslJ